MNDQPYPGAQPPNTGGNAYPPPQPGYPAGQPMYPPVQPGYPPPGMAPPYPYPPAVAPDTKSGQAITGFVLGIVSMLAWLLPICGFPVSIAGIVFSAIGRGSTTRKTLATWGLVLSIIAIGLSLLNGILGAYLRLRAGGYMQ